MFGTLWSTIGNMFSDQRSPTAPTRPDQLRENTERIEARPPLSSPAVTVAKPEVAIANLSAEQEAVLVSREVLDDQLCVLGYEFTVRTELYDKLHTQSAQIKEFLNGVLIDHLPALNHAVAGERRPYIRIMESALQGPAMDRLPERAAILLTPEDAKQIASQATIERITNLRESGREVWLDNCPATRWLDSIGIAASGAIIRLENVRPREVSGWLEQASEDHPHLPLAAWDMSTMEEFELAKKFGYVRFSGSFVTNRTDWQGQKLSPQALSVATLINQLRTDADIHEMADVFKQDMAMSYRLLRYANAVGKAPDRKIASIEQALVHMGQTQLDRWLTLLLVGGGIGTSNALIEHSLTRARFLELLGTGRMSDEQCESLFVLGLFSMLDIALKVPLEEAIRPLRLPDVMSRALIQHDGPFGAYLSLVDACEQGKTNDVLKYAVSVGLTARKVNARHIEALAWVNAAEATADADPSDDTSADSNTKLQKTRPRHSRA